MATKVILTQDVEHLGAAGTVQTVKEGFARNYLLPKRLAEIATTGTIKQVQERQAAVERRIRKQEEELRSLGDKIAATTLTFTARVGENGRLFGSITARWVKRLTGARSHSMSRSAASGSTRSPSGSSVASSHR